MAVKPESMAPLGSYVLIIFDITLIIEVPWVPCFSE